MMIVVIIGCFGYKIIENYNWVESFYMTIITLSTVGFSEVRTLSDSGRIFTVVLIAANFTVIGYFVSVVSGYLFDGEFKKDFQLYKMKKQIEELKNHVIICGFGRNGRAAAQMLLRNHVPFVVIEKDTEQFEETEMDIPFHLHSDATREEVLLEAGIKNAKALITTLPDDAANVFVVLSAKELNKNLLIISRATNDSSVRKLKHAGANNVIMPDKLGGVHMANLVINPDVKEFLDWMQMEEKGHFLIKEIRCNKNFILNDLKLWEKTGASILGIKNADHHFILNPGPHYKIEAGQLIILMGEEVQIEKAKNLLS